MKTTALTDIMADLACSIAQVQRQLDGQFEKDKKQLEDLMAKAPTEVRPLLTGLAPNRQLVRKHEVNARMRMQQEKTIGASVSIGVQLLNFSADLRFQRDTSKDSQINICVEQVPAPP